MTKLSKTLSYLLVFVMLGVSISACAAPTKAPTVVPTEAPTAAPTEEATPEVTEPPVVHTERKGGWLDEIVYTVADPSAVLTQIKAGDVDIYAEGLPPAFAQEVFDSGLSYSTSQGTYFDILFNPATFSDGRFNPFSNQKSAKPSTGWWTGTISFRKYSMEAVRQNSSPSLLNGRITLI